MSPLKSTFLHPHKPLGWHSKHSPHPIQTRVPTTPELLFHRRPGTLSYLEKKSSRTTSTSSSPNPFSWSLQARTPFSRRFGTVCYKTMRLGVRKSVLTFTLFGRTSTYSKAVFALTNASRFLIQSRTL